MKRNFNKITGFFQIIVLFLLTIIPLLSQNNTLIRVQAEVDKSIITIGDRLNYTLTIDHQEGIRIEQPGPGANLGQFEIKDYQIHDPAKKNGNIIQKFEYEISVFDTGKFVIPPFPVAFFKSDTSRNFQIIQSEPIEIFVESVLTADNRELRDIKPPQSIPFNLKKWLIYGLITLFIIVSTVATIYYINRRKKGIPLFRKEKIRPAHEIAMETLTELKNRWQYMLQKGEAKLLFTEISDILRKYLENRFFIKALEETTFEISQSLAEMEIGEKQQIMAIQVLEFADLVKFAKYIPDEGETENTFEMLEKFIDETKLIFETVEHQVEISQEDTDNQETSMISSRDIVEKQ
jgi:hypothetical protein